MADSKLSGLTTASSAATADLAYIVQGGTSKQISFDNLQQSITKIGVLTTDIKIGSGNYFYIGDSSTNGSWRFCIDGDNLAFQRRESGNWVEKGLVTA